MDYTDYKNFQGFMNAIGGDSFLARLGIIKYVGTSYTTENISYNARTNEMLVRNIQANKKNFCKASYCVISSKVETSGRVGYERTYTYYQFNMYNKKDMLVYQTEWIAAVSADHQFKAMYFKRYDKKADEMVNYSSRYKAHVELQESQTK